MLIYIEDFSIYTGDKGNMCMSKAVCKDLAA